MLYFTPSAKLTFDPLGKEDQSAVTLPLQHLSKIKDADTVTPLEMALKTSSSQTLNRGGWGADKKMESPNYIYFA